MKYLFSLCLLKWNSWSITNSVTTTIDHLQNYTMAYLLEYKDK